MSQETILAGFAEPVSAAQQAFQAALQAMARPGALQRTATPQEFPGNMPPAMAALALTLVDASAPVWLSPNLAGAAGYLRFHCGGPITAQPGEAAFALAHAAEQPSLEPLCSDDFEWPERSTTLILAVEALGEGRTYVLQGPGIAEQTTLRCRGLSADFTDQWQANHDRYPRGTDVFLVADDRVVGLPRSLSLGQ